VQQRAGLLALPQPLRLGAAGVQHGEARALPVGLLKQLRQQALGLAEGAVPAGRGRGIDNHQPQLASTSATSFMA
jgi:hypothetical protein